MRLGLISVVLALSAIMFQPAIAEEIQTILEEKCGLCHGEEGETSSAVYPRLAGQHRNYLEKQLKNFRDGVRQSDTMTEMARDLTDAQIAALSEYYSAQPALSHRIRSSQKSLEAVGFYIFHKGNEYTQIPPCTACHGDNGEGDEDLPRLAGQHRRYVVDQLQAFNERKRTNDNAIMHTIAANLTELEINAVALYVSGMKPKAGDTEK